MKQRRETEPEAQVVTSSDGEATQHNEPYSIFTPCQKRWIVSLAAATGMFSPLSSLIYYPATTSMATGLNTTVSMVNLAITSYLVISAILPAVLGDVADQMGRRPVYIGALLIYLVANVGLALQRNFVALLLLRMLQSAGISGKFDSSMGYTCLRKEGTISLGYGVLADIATPAERGLYVGLFSLG
jgi:MFS family permease